MNLEQIIKSAETVVRASGHHYPQLIGVRQDGSALMAVLMDMPDSSVARQAYLFHAGWSLAKEGEVLDTVYFITEAWMAKQDPDKPLRLPVSAQPDKIEVLLIAEHSFYHDQQLQILELVRDSDDHVTNVVRQPMADGSIKSNITDAFWAGYRAGMEAG